MVDTSICKFCGKPIFWPGEFTPNRKPYETEECKKVHACQEGERYFDSKKRLQIPITRSEKCKIFEQLVMEMALMEPCECTLCKKFRLILESYKK